MNQTKTNFVLPAVAVALTAGLVSVIVGLLLGGGASPLQFADPGPVVRWGAPFAKLVMNFAMATAAGSLVLSAFAGNESERARLSPKHVVKYQQYNSLRKFYSQKMQALCSPHLAQYQLNAKWRVPEE